jgi:hypothetical protein
VISFNDLDLIISFLNLRFQKKKFKNNDLKIYNLKKKIKIIKRLSNLLTFKILHFKKALVACNLKKQFSAFLNRNFQMVHFLRFGL